jgi:hypothetical protein
MKHIKWVMELVGWVLLGVLSLGGINVSLTLMQQPDTLAVFGGVMTFAGIVITWVSILLVVFRIPVGE